MSQNSDCPINKPVILSFDAKEGQQSTFPLESNLDGLISSMLKGINDEYTKPISVVPAGAIMNEPAPFVKLNTPDTVIIPPGVPSVPSVVSPIITSPLVLSAAPVAAAVVQAPTEPVVAPQPVVTPVVTLGAPVDAPVATVGAPVGAPIATVGAPIATVGAPVAPEVQEITPNQPAENVMSPMPLEVAATTSSVEQFENSCNQDPYLMSKIIGILLLILVGFLILVKLEYIKYN